MCRLRRVLRVTVDPGNSIGGPQEDAVIVAEEDIAQLPNRAKRLYVRHDWQMALNFERIAISPLTSTIVGDETKYSINVVLWGVEGVLDATARLTASSATWTSSVDKLSVRARVPENTKLHGATLAALVALIRSEVHRALIARNVDFVHRDPDDGLPEPEALIAEAFSNLTRKRHRHDDEYYVPFALMAVEKMNRPREEFPQVTSGRVYYPRVLYGRLDHPYNIANGFKRSDVTRYINVCVERDLLVVGAGADASWSLTEKCQRIAREMGLART